MVSTGFKKYKTDKYRFSENIIKINKFKFNIFTNMLCRWYFNNRNLKKKKEINYTISKLKEKYKISKDSDATKNNRNKHL